jgi:hypothetical protein
MTKSGYSTGLYVSYSAALFGLQDRSFGTDIALVSFAELLGMNHTFWSWEL